MGGEDQCRFAVLRQGAEALDIFRIDLDASAFGMLDVEIPQPVEVGELRADAAEIVPDAAQDRFYFCGCFFGERGREIGAADLVFRQQRAEFAHHRTGGIRHAVGIDHDAMI